MAIAWALSIDRAGGMISLKLASRPSPHTGDTRTISLSRWDAIGRTWIAAGITDFVPASSPEQRTPFDKGCPAWARRDLLPWLADPDDPAYTRAVIATGWPMRAAFLTFEQQPAGGYWWFKSRDGIVVRAAPPNWNLSPLTPRELALATRLRPLGFTADTIFFAAAWGFILWAPGALRRWRRRARSACPGCGYSRRGLAAGVPCPECGG